MHIRLGQIPALFLSLLFVAPALAQATDPRVVAADTAYADKRYQDALSLYQAIADSDLPRDVRARAQSKVAHCDYNLGDKEGARLAWLRAAERFPDSSTYACEGLLRAGNLASAAHDLTGAIDAYTRASVDAYCQAEGAKPFAVQAMCWLGNAHVKAWTQARTESVEQAEAKGVVPIAKTVWEASLPSYLAATHAYEQLVSRFPESDLAQEAAMQLLALQYDRAVYSAGRLEDVVTSADQYLTQYPGARRQLAVVHQVRGEALYGQGQYDLALGEFLLVQEKYGDIAGQTLGTSQYFLARCFERKGDYERAITEFERFLTDAKPSFDPPNERAAARLAIASMLRIQRKWDAAISAFKRVSGEFPGTTWDRQATAALEGLGRDRALAQKEAR